MTDNNNQELEQKPIKQVVDFDGNFCTDLKDTMAQWDFLNKGFDYWVVAIIGCQSSGKSTLLNRTFNTNFDVMVAEVARKQTTKGIWFGRSGTKEKPILIFDVEGTDSRERRKENGVFERKSSLFSLALAEVLMINIWCHDIGRDGGAYYNLFTIVFDLNLQLFAKSEGKATKTLLFFILRDYYGETAEDVLMHTVYDDMKQVWERINKPDQFKNDDITKFFDFDHFSIPHIKSPNFDSRISELKSMFYDTSNPHTPLQPKYKKGVPSDGFPMHTQNIWEIISQNKDLDLPSQKHLLSMYRCDEILKVAYENFMSKIQNMKSQINAGDLYTSFGPEAKGYLEESLAIFDNEAKRYDSDVYEEFRAKLLDKINSDLFPLFQILLKSVMNHHRTRFEKSLRELQGSGKNLIENFYQRSTELIEFTINSFSQMVMDQLIPEFQWAFGIEKSDFERNVYDKMDVLRSTQLELFYTLTSENIKQQFLRQMAQVFELSEEDMWEKIREYYYSESKKRDEEYHAKLKELFGNIDFPIKDIEEVSLNAVHLALKEKVKNIDVLMERRFSKLFKLDEQGVPKRWKPGDKIQEIWVQSKEKVEPLIDLYSILRIRTEDDRFSFFEKINNRYEIKQVIPEVPHEIIIIQPDECMVILERFRERTTIFYNEAIKEQESAMAHGSIPKFFLLLLFILGFNELKWALEFMFSSPISFVFLLFASIIAYVIYALHMWPIIKPIVNPIIEGIRQALFVKLEETLNNFTKPKQKKD